MIPRGRVRDGDYRRGRPRRGQRHHHACFEAADASPEPPDARARFPCYQRAHGDAGRKNRTGIRIGRIFVSRRICHCPRYRYYDFRGNVGREKIIASNPLAIRRFASSVKNTTTLHHLFFPYETYRIYPGARSASHRLGRFLEERTHRPLVLRLGRLALPEIRLSRTRGRRRVLQYVRRERRERFLRFHRPVRPGGADETRLLHDGRDEGIFPPGRPGSGSRFRRNARRDTGYGDFRRGRRPFPRNADRGLERHLGEFQAAFGGFGEIARILLFSGTYTQ